MTKPHTMGAHVPDLRIDTLRAVQKAGGVLFDAGLIDARDRMVAHTQRALTPGVVVAVVGSAGSGKSALVNGVIGSPLAVVDDRYSTAVPTVLRDTSVPELALRRVVDGRILTVGVATEGLPSLSTSFGNEANRLGVLRVEVGTPNPVLATGFTIVDTPPDALPAKGPSRASALAAVVDALVLAVPADRPISPGELGLVRRARTRGATVVVAVTRLDSVGSPGTAVDEVRAALDADDLDAEVIGTSYAWRILAGSRPEAPEIDAASGFRSLVDHLDRSTRRPAQDVAARRAIAEARSGIAQAELLDGARRAASGDPAVSAALARGIAVLSELDRADAHWVRELGERFSGLARDVVIAADSEIAGVASMSRLSAARARLDEVVADAVASFGHGVLDIRADAAARLIADVERSAQLPLGPVVAAELALVESARWPAGDALSVEGFRDPVRRFYDLVGGAAVNAGSELPNAAGGRVTALADATRESLAHRVEAMSVAAANGAAVGIGRRLADFRSGLERTRFGTGSPPPPVVPPGTVAMLADLDARLGELVSGGASRD